MAEDARRKIKVRVQFPESDLPGLFANHASIQFFGDVYVLTFFAAIPPLAAKPTAEVEEISVVADPIARVVIPADRMPDIVKAMSMNVAQNSVPQEEPQA